MIQRDDIEVQNEEIIKIKVKTIDSNEYVVEVNPHSLVGELKTKIETATHVPAIRQRLIFQGKLLKDNEKISGYKITDLNVVHLVAKAGTAESENTNTQPQPNSNNIRNPFFDIFDNIVDGDSSGTLDLNEIISRRNDNPFSSNPSLNRTRPYINRRNRSQTNRHNTIVDLKESKETIYQGCATLDNLISGLKENKDIVIQPENNSNHLKIDFLNNSKRKYEKGQWVDVKDTINEWLEAQIIDIKDNKVFVHYNGWDTRWDEWISVDSDRIQLFRTHSSQTSFNNYNSPFPVAKPDTNVTIANDEKLDFIDISKKLKNYMSIANNMIDDILEKNKVKNEENQKNTVLELHKFTNIMDRMGRIFSDSSLYLNSSLKSKNFNNIDPVLFSTPEWKDVFEKNLTTDINPLQTPLGVFQANQNQTPSFFDIVVHTTYISPFSNGNNSRVDGGLNRILDRFNRTSNDTPSNQPNISTEPTNLNNIVQNTERPSTPEAQFLNAKRENKDELECVLNEIDKDKNDKNNNKEDHEGSENQERKKSNNEDKK